MSELFELPKNLAYPTADEITELARIADTCATETNIHKVKGIISTINLINEVSIKKGWNEQRLNQFIESKTRLFETLSGAKTE